MSECPLDPGGYFVVKGTEKVILVQEQLSKNRIIVEADSKKGTVSPPSPRPHTSASPSPTSSPSTAGSSSSTIRSTWTSPSPSLSRPWASRQTARPPARRGHDDVYKELFAINLEEAARLGVYTRKQALDFIGRARKASRKPLSMRRPLAEEALDVLATVIMAHVPSSVSTFAQGHLHCLHGTQGAHGHAGREEGRRPRLRRKQEARARRSAPRPALRGPLQEVQTRTSSSTSTNPQEAQPHRRVRCLQQFHFNGDYITRASSAPSPPQLESEAFQDGARRWSPTCSAGSHTSAALGMMTRISSQFEKTRKVSGPRALQPSQWGMLCPSDTPKVKRAVSSRTWRSPRTSPRTSRRSPSRPRRIHARRRGHPPPHRRRALPSRLVCRLPQR